MQTCDMRERLEFHRSFGVLRCRAGFKSLDNFVITSHERANMNGTRQNHSCRVWGRQSQTKTASSHSILPLLAFCLLLSTLYAIVLLSAVGQQQAHTFHFWSCWFWCAVRRVRVRRHNPIGSFSRSA
jgi:hypothetical protein